jgi:hypothetical protein
MAKWRAVKSADVAWRRSQTWASAPVSSRPRRAVVQPAVTPVASRSRIRGPVTARLDEPGQIGRRVGQWMVVELRVLQHGAVQQRLHPPRAIVDQGKRRHAARRDAEDRLEQVRLAERQTRTAEHLRQAVQVIRRWLRQISSQSLPFLSLRNRFLQLPPGRCPVCRSASSTVQTGACSQVACVMPSSSKRRSSPADRSPWRWY